MARWRPLVISKGKDEAYVKVLQKLTNAIRARNTATDGVTKVMVMKRKEAPRNTFVLRVGAYDSPLQK